MNKKQRKNKQKKERKEKQMYNNGELQNKVVCTFNFFYFFQSQFFLEIEQIYDFSFKKHIYLKIYKRLLA